MTERTTVSSVVRPPKLFSWDRLPRLVLGLSLLSLLFWGPKTLWGLVGLAPLLTGIGFSCPLSTLAGSRTCATPPDERAEP
jgi:hypothetical protein